MTRLKITILWGLLLFIVNTVVLTALTSFLTKDTATIIGLLFVPISSVIISFKGILSLRSHNLKDQNKFHPIVEGIFIVLAANLLDTIYLYIVSGGEAGFDIVSGVIWGAAGGLLAKRKLK